MDLPVEKWKLYAKQKWTSLEPALKEKLCPALSLRDCFLLFSPLFQSEDEEYLYSLARNYCVKKDPSMVLLYKAEGNERFRKKEYRTAGMLYSKALAHTEVSTPERAVCYANRSAALFHLDQFEVCLEDIGRALEKGCSHGLYPKIMLRKAECLLSLGRPQEAAEALCSLESKMSAEQSLAADSSQMLLNKLGQLKAKACQGSSFVRPPALPSRTQKGLEPWEENNWISCASAAVRLSVSPSKGRYLAAARDILPGETLVREEAFVSVLCPGEILLLRGSADTTLDEPSDNEDLNCHHCLRRLLASVPCQGCSYAKYCSQTCAQLAWKNYHRIECSLGGLLLTLGVFCHVAFRAILVAGFAEVNTLTRQSCGDDLGEADVAKVSASKEQDLASVPGCDVDGRYRSSYRAVFNLLPHTEKQSPEFLFLCSLSIAALCQRLEDAHLAALVCGKSISESQEGAKAAELKNLGEAMLKHMLQLRCNAQAVTTLRESGSGDKPVASSEQVRLAVGLFPVVSLLNHSCDPNTSVTFKSTTAEVRALQPIAQGQEILHCYGPHKCRMGVAERRKELLSQYFFECQCLPCRSERGSSSQRSASQHGVFRCPACQAPLQGEGMLHCSREACKVQISEDRLQHQLHELQQLTKTALELLDNSQPDRSVKLLLRCRLEARRLLSPEHLMVGEMEDHLAQAYVTLGKWQEAAGHLHSSIQVVEAHYGPSSIEVGQELFKLAQVLFNGVARSKNCKRCKPASKNHWVPPLRQEGDCCHRETYTPCETTK
ncbi:SET and MYND domain-containing protein 4 isoform X2 [Eublepharis macularius]|uniref:Protein-lysine N-methyltransferase SMYD4 n=1 Tax=Eublepharis macularius TaxID=481883 RepID=A0AA97KJZ3_EUBMA|nr:SET and MYND domain-containing protein 4 isoform X2 [Eublepharis macularius]